MPEMDPQAALGGEGTTPPAGSPPQANNTPDQGGEPQGQPQGDPQGQPAGEPNQGDPAGQGSARPNRIESRIRKLSGMVRDSHQNPQGQGGQGQSPFPQMPPQMALQQALNSIREGEMSTDQLRNAVAQAAGAMAAAEGAKIRHEFSQKLSAQEKATQFDRDVTYVESKFAKLNPDSDQFDEKYSTALVEQYEKASKVNPDLRLSEFVEGIEALVSLASEKRSSEISNSLGRQAAEGAITPNTGSRGRKSAKDETIEEMEARLGKVY